MKVKWQLTAVMSNRVLSSTGTPPQLSRDVGEVMFSSKFPNSLCTKDLKASVASSTLLSNFLKVKERWDCGSCLLIYLEAGDKRSTMWLYRDVCC